MQMYNPPAPGEILSEDYLKPLGIKPAEFASRLGLDIVELNELLAGHSPVTADLALRLGITLS
ncbi:MAG: HigA family addiction module antitoxin, partial [Phormidesmis sp.]